MATRRAEALLLRIDGDLGQLNRALVKAEGRTVHSGRGHFRAAAQSLENTVVEGHGATTENQIETTRRHATNSLEELFVNLAVAAHEARNGGAVESAK